MPGKNQLPPCRRTLRDSPQLSSRAGQQPSTGPDPTSLRAESSRTHRRAALGAPAAGQPGPSGPEAGAEPRGARGALRERADAQARSRPRSRTASPSSHPHAHAGGARRAGSAAEASAGAQGIPGMRRRLLSPGLRQTRQDTPPDTPLPPSRWGRAQVNWQGCEGGASHARSGAFPVPRPLRARRLSATRRARARARSSDERPRRAWCRAGPEKKRQSQRARRGSLSHTSHPQGPASGNTPECTRTTPADPFVRSQVSAAVDQARSPHAHSWSSQPVNTHT